MNRIAPVHIAPFDTHVDTHVDTASHSAVYELVENSALPVLDMSKSVRSEWMHPWLAKKWTRFVRHYHLPIVLGMYVALVLDFLGVILTAAPGRWCMLFALVLGAPSCVVRLTLLRSDVVRLLHGKYEYWFFTCANTVAVTLLGLHLGDSRACQMPGMWLGIQTCVLVDANVASARHYMNATAAILIYICVLTPLVFFELVDEAHHFTVFRTGRRVVTNETALANVWLTLIVMIVRNLYRRRAAMKMNAAAVGNRDKVYCIDYRCCIKLVRVETMNAPVALGDAVTAVVPTGLPPTGVLSLDTSDTTLTQLELVKVEKQFDAARVVFPAMQRLLLQRGDVPWTVRATILALAATGIATSVASFTLASTDATTRRRVQTIAFATSSAVFVVGASALQRGMLKQLVSSFDFAFLSTQLSLAHAGACDLFSWDSRCLVVAASWMWCHLALSLDALTPLAKARWHFCVQLAAPVMLVFIAAQVAMATAIMHDVDPDIHDRIVFRVRVHRRTVAVNVAAFTVTRIVTLLGWSCRMLWRIWRQHGDDLILLHGSVCYDTKRTQVRLQKIRVANQVQS